MPFRHFRVTALWIVCLSFAAAAWPEEFSIGGTKIEIPAPEGFVIVGDDMSAVQGISQRMNDSLNDMIAYYIDETDAPAARKGELPPLRRTFMVKVNKSVRDSTMSEKDFVGIKEAAVAQNAQIMKKVEDQLPEELKRLNKGITSELGVDAAISVSNMVPLDAHLNTDNAWAFSMYAKVSATGTEAETIVATSAFVNVAGKLIFFYTYAPKEEIGWTREASTKWVNAVLSANPEPPAVSNLPKQGFNWGEVFWAALIAAVVGGVVAWLRGIGKRKAK